MPRVKRKEPSFQTDETPLWEYIYQNVVENQFFDAVDRDLLQLYKEECKVQFSVPQLEQFYTEVMQPALYKSDLEETKILELYKALKIEVSTHIEHMLESRCHMFVRISQNRHVIDWRSMRKSTPAAEVARPPVPKRRKTTIEMSELSEESKSEIWNFIRDRREQINSQTLLSEELFRQFSNGRKINFEPSELSKYFRKHMLPELWEQRMDANFKLQLLKDLKVTFNDIQRSWFLENEKMEVEVGEDGIIVAWKSAEETVEEVTNFEPEPVPELEASTSKILTWKARSPVPIKYEMAELEDDLSRFEKKKGTRQKFTDQDVLLAWHYMISEIFDEESGTWDATSVQPKGNVFWQKFVKKVKSTKLPSNWASYYRKRMCPTLHEVQLPIEKKLHLFKHLSIPLAEDVRRLLECQSNVEIKLSPLNTVVSWKRIKTEPEEHHIELEVTQPTEDAEYEDEAMIEESANVSTDSVEIEAQSSESLAETVTLEEPVIETPRRPDGWLDLDAEVVHAISEKIPEEDLELLAEAVEASDLFKEQYVERRAV